jgi:ParB family transcriptional regulator, chromosome partitioning protein
VPSKLGKQLKNGMKKSTEHARDQARMYVQRPLSDLRPNPDQPRKVYDETGIAELADSIARHGLMNPITVRPDGTIVAGERRYRACVLLEMEKVPVYVLDGGSTLEASLVENLQREDLHPLEEAQAIRQLCDEDGIEQKAAAARLGKTPTYVSELTGLLRLPETVRDEWLRNSEVASKSLMIQIAAVDEVADQLAAWERVKAGDLKTTAAKREKKESTERKAVQPRSVISGLRKMRESVEGLAVENASSWKRKDELREEIDATIERLRKLRGELGA